MAEHQQNRTQGIPEKRLPRFAHPCSTGHGPRCSRRQPRRPNTQSGILRLDVRVFEGDRNKNSIGYERFYYIARTLLI